MSNCIKLESYLSIYPLSVQLHNTNQTYNYISIRTSLYFDNITFTILFQNCVYLISQFFKNFNISLIKKHFEIWMQKGFYWLKKQIEPFQIHPLRDRTFGPHRKIVIFDINNFYCIHWITSNRSLSKRMTSTNWLTI